MKTCYKVVKTEDGKLVSCVAYKKAQVTYEEDKWIKAPEWLRDSKRGLFVFETFEQAQSFVYSMSADNYQIWECRYRRKTENPKYLSLVGLADGKLNDPIFAKSFPAGTIHVEQVKLIRKI